jgi:hypothetical protein
MWDWIESLFRQKGFEDSIPVPIGRVDSEPVIEQDLEENVEVEVITADIGRVIKRTVI